MKPVFYMIILTAILSCKLNRVDEKHLKQGKWKVYYDDEKTKLLSKGRYKDHHQTGTWKYYLASGNIYMREKYVKNGMVKTVYYYPTGVRQLEGIAQYTSSPDTSYYRWEGDWKKYDSTGTLVRIAFYKCGKLAWYKPLK